MKKSLLRKHIDHIKHNPHGYWFKRKLYGYGWVPAKIEGWIVILIFLAYVVADTINFTSSPSTSQGNTLWYLTKIIIAVLILIFICYKTGEKPHWSWGE